MFPSSSQIVNVKTTASFTPSEKNGNKPVVYFKIPHQESLYISSITILCDVSISKILQFHKLAGIPTFQAFKMFVSYINFMF